MREMEMVLRFYRQVSAKTANGRQERFKGPPPEFLLAIGFQVEEMAGRISKWKRMESNQGRPRGILHGAIYLRNKWWKEVFKDYDLDPPKPHTELVTRQGDRVSLSGPPSSPAQSRRRRLETSRRAAPGEGHSSSTPGSSCRQ
jgi:hypothetical protein